MPASALVLLLEVLLRLAAWFALQTGTLPLPPIVIFFTLDNALFIAVLVFLFCAVDFALHRTATRLVITILALVPFWMGRVLL